MRILATALLVVAVSCAPPRDTLRVERVLGINAVGRFDPFDRTISDAEAVRDLEQIVRSLPPGRTDTFCPIAWGLHYRLTFAGTPKTTFVAVVEADGCRLAYLGPTDVRATTESFWAQLAGALGLYTRGTDLFPLPRDLPR